MKDNNNVLFLFLHSIMSEKIIHTQVSNLCKQLNIKLRTDTNKIFNGKVPPCGWSVDKSNRYLFIFDYRDTKKQYTTEGIKQLKTYYDIVLQHKLKYKIVPVFVYGVDNITAKVINDFNNKLDDCVNLKEFYTQGNKVVGKEVFNFNPHTVNQYFYDNFRNISSSDKLKIIVTVLLTIAKAGNDSLADVDIPTKCLEIEKLYKMDEYFTFIVNPPYNKCVERTYEYFKNVDTSEILRIVHDCFVDISKWSFKGAKGQQEKVKLTQDEGAVLTPPDIVQLMIKELNMEPLSIVCDPCSGTGNFLLEVSKHKPSKIIGNELDTTRYVMLKHGLIISNSNYEVTNVDCMLSSYKPVFDYLLFNPPYSHGKEKQFVLKFIELSRKGGVVIIPKNNFIDDDFMEDINKICNPVKLIQLNNKVFYPIASVECSILVYNKLPNEHNLQVYDFRNDGYICHRNHGRVFKESKEPVLLCNDNSPDDNTPDNISYLIYERMLDPIIIDFKKRLKQELYTDELNKQYTRKVYNISDLFEYIGRGDVKNNSCKDGDYPLISATRYNNGVVKYIDTYRFECSKSEPLITVGDIGIDCVFIQYCNFNANQHVHVLKPKVYDIDLNIVVAAMMFTFNSKYNWSYSISKERLMKETISIPIDFTYKRNIIVDLLSSIKDIYLQ